MKVRLVIDADEHARFVIAKYFAPVGDARDRVRRRATRAQVRRFVLAALRTHVREQAGNLGGRSRGAATRLSTGADAESETLRPSREQQLSLL